MYILWDDTNRQTEVFPDGSGRLLPWLARMPEGWNLEYAIDSTTPGKLVCTGKASGTHFTDFGLACVRADGLAADSDRIKYMLVFGGNNPKVLKKVEAQNPHEAASAAGLTPVYLIFWGDKPEAGKLAKGFAYSLPRLNRLLSEAQAAHERTKAQ